MQQAATHRHPYTPRKSRPRVAPAFITCGAVSSLDRSTVNPLDQGVVETPGLLVASSPADYSGHTPF